jgi:hypothetical protein
MLLAGSIVRYRAHRHGWSGVLQVGFRLWLAKRLINLAWVAYFYMAVAPPLRFAWQCGRSHLRPSYSNGAASDDTTALVYDGGLG